MFKSQGLARCPPASPHRTPSACCCPGPAQRGGHVRARRAPAGLDPAPRAPRRPGAFQGCSPGLPSSVRSAPAVGSSRVAARWRGQTQSVFVQGMQSDFSITRSRGRSAFCHGEVSPCAVPQSQRGRGAVREPGQRGPAAAGAGDRLLVQAEGAPHGGQPGLPGEPPARRLSLFPGRLSQPVCLSRFVVCSLLPHSPHPFKRTLFLRTASDFGKADDGGS